MQAMPEALFKLDRVKSAVAGALHAAGAKTYKAKSHTVIDFKGRHYYGGGEKTFCELKDGLEHFVVLNLNLHGYSYGFLGGKGGAKNITLVNVTMEGRGNLISGNSGLVNNVTMIGCYTNIARMCLPGAESRNWNVYDCHSDLCYDSAFYMKGYDHTVENCTARLSGKDAFKVNQWGAGEWYGAGESSNVRFINCTAYGYSLLVSNSGAAFNLSCHEARLVDCTAYVYERADVMPKDKTLRCVNIQRPGNVVEGLLMVYPDAKRYEGMLIQGSAEGETNIISAFERAYEIDEAA